MKKILFILFFLPVLVQAQFAINDQKVYIFATSLRAQKGTPNVVYKVLNLATLNDRKGGEYMWDSTSVATDDGFTYLQANGVPTGRYFKIMTTYRGIADLNSALTAAPISTAQQSAFDAELNRAIAIEQGISSGLANILLSVSNINNTSDLNKPVSTAQKALFDTKVDIVAGKVLSTNDYSSAEKLKVAGVATGATVSGVNTGDQDLTAFAKTSSLPAAIAAYLVAHPYITQTSSNTLSAIVALGATSTIAITFATPMPDANWTLGMIMPSGLAVNGTIGTSNKTATGITITFTAGTVALPIGTRFTVIATEQTP